MWGQAGAEALVRQGLWEGAIAFAEAVRSSTNPGFFESVRGPKLHPSCGQEFLKFVLTAALKQARQADRCSDHMLEGLVPQDQCALVPLPTPRRGRREKPRRRKRRSPNGSLRKRPSAPARQAFIAAARRLAGDPSVTGL
jgi:hypothetical protein